MPQKVMNNKGRTLRWKKPGVPEQKPEKGTYRLEMASFQLKMSKTME